MWGLVFALCAVLFVALFVGWRRMRRRVARQIRRSASGASAKPPSVAGRPAGGTRKTAKPSFSDASVRAERARWNAFVQRNDRIVSLRDVAALAGLSPTLRPSQKQRHDMTAVAEIAGFRILPDVTRTERACSWDTPVALMPLERVSGTFPAICLLLELGIGIAATDGVVSAAEVGALSSFLKEQHQPSPYETRLIDVLMDILVKAPSAPDRIAKAIRDVLTEGQLRLVADLLVRIAASDGVVSAGERKTLERIFRVFGIPETVLDGQMRALLPERCDTVGVMLDPETLRRVREQTRDVAMLLGQVFNAAADPEEDADEDVPPIFPETENRPQETGADFVASSPSDDGDDDGPPFLESLNAPYRDALLDLLRAPKWTKKDLAALARSRGLMPGALVETVNDWSDEHLGDLLIFESDEGYAIRTELTASRAEAQSARSRE